MSVYSPSTSAASPLILLRDPCAVHQPVKEVAPAAVRVDVISDRGKTVFGQPRGVVVISDFKDWFYGAHLLIRAGIFRSPAFCG